VIPLQMLLAALLAWLEAEQRDVISFLHEENRVLKSARPDCRAAEVTRSVMLGNENPTTITRRALGASSV
jgi:hypothetical protein